MLDEIDAAFAELVKLDLDEKGEKKLSS